MAGDGLIHVRPQPLICVATVEIQNIVGLFDRLVRNRERDSFGDRAILPSGVDPVEVLAVDRAEVDGAAQERGHVGYVYQDEGTGERGGIDLASKFLQGQDGRILISVIPGDEGNHGPWLGAANGGDRNLCARVLCGGDLDDAGIDSGGRRGLGSLSHRHIVPVCSADTRVCLRRPGLPDVARTLVSAASRFVSTLFGSHQLSACGWAFDAAAPKIVSSLFVPLCK